MKILIQALMLIIFLGALVSAGEISEVVNLSANMIIHSSQFPLGNR